MKKTVTANISGIVFHIDEDAYERLNLYLAQVREHLSSEDGTDEILSDIEGRIAEMFQEKLTSAKTVITIDDVKEVISQLGEPEQYEDAEEDTGSKKQKQKQKDNEKEHRRLYRDPDDKYLAGVAGGLASFFNLDPVWIRAAFILFTFFYGFGPILYIILWIVVPKARTTAEKLEMRGEKVNISNIEKSIREELHDIKENLKEFSKDARDTFKEKDKKKRRSERDSSRHAGLIRAFSIAAGIILLIISFSMILAILSSLFLIPVAFYATGNIFQIHLPEVLGLFIPSPFVSKLALVGIILVISIPIFWILLTAIQLLFGLRAKFRVLGAITLILWLSGIGMVVFAGLSGASNFTSNVEGRTGNVLEESAWPNLYVSFNENKTDGMPVHWKRAKIAGRNFAWFENNFHAMGKPDLRIVRSRDDKVFLEVITESWGSSPWAANEIAGNIRYDFQQKDSLLILDPIFTFDKNDGWRNQNVSLELHVPEGKTVVLPMDHKNIFPVNWNRNVRVREDG